MREHSVRRDVAATEPCARPEDRGPLSYGQQRLWFLDRWLGDSPAYNVPVTLRFSGPLLPDRLIAAMASVAARHDVVFTVFDDEGGEPRQRLLGDRELACPFVDLAAGDVTERRARAEELIRADAQRPFDLSAGPMLRAALYRLAEDEHWLHLTWHHIACDGWSLNVFQRQLLEAYRHGAQETDPPLIQYADYALWQRERLTEPWAEKGLAAWRETLRSAPALLDLGADHPRPAELSYRGRTVEFALPDVPAHELKEFAAHSGASLYMVLLAAFQALAARHSGSDDIVLGSPVAGRDRAALDEMVGMFVDLLVLRSDLEDDPSFRELVSRARASVLNALSRSKVPFDLAVNQLHPDRSLAHNPIVQVVFAFHEEEPSLPLGDGLTVERFMMPTDTAKFDITWSVYHRPDGLRLEVEYATDLYEFSTIRVLVDHWQTLLRQAIATPDVPVSRLELMPPTERALVASRAGEDAEFPAGTVHGLVTEQAELAPDAVAVVYGQERLSYGALNARANALAHYLRDLGVGPEVPVAVCVERSKETVVATLGVMKAGGVYVPLDIDFPAERMEFMLRDLGARLVLVSGDAGGRVPDGPWQKLDLDDLPQDSRHDSPADLVGPDNGCYVIFTSGSTGRPKGTLVTHGNVTRLFEATGAAGLTVDRDDVWTLFHSFAFDFSVWEMWGALSTGGRLVVVPHAVSRDAEAFYGLVHRERVTVLSQTPSAFRQFETVDGQAAAHLDLRAVIFGGEALHQPSVRRWAGRHGYRTPLLVNMYGITETTVHVTYLELAEHHLNGATSRIGRPLPDLRVHVLDKHGRPCPIGVTGEVYVAGAGVTRGYVGRAQLTAERFVPDHLDGRPGGRLYRTGDVARWTAAGDLEYLGRTDTQVKIRGHRIEIGEIEATFQTHPSVLEAVVNPHRGADEQTDLAAYLVSDGDDVPAGELRAWLSARLPDYMVPRWFVFLDVLPLTTQGKVDRRALPEPSSERPELIQQYVAPLPGDEASLAGIWSRVLGVDRVGRHDNFFDLGGDSIRSIQILGQAREAGFAFTLQDLFRHPVLAELAGVTGDGADEAAERDADRDRAPFSLVSPRDRKRLPEGLVDAYPMAELQIGMVYEMELDPDRRPYHNVDSLRIAGPFDEAMFRDAVARVVEWHPILRTSFDLSGYSEPMQLVHATAEMPFTIADLRGIDRDTQESVIAAYIDAERGHRFDHSRPLLLRFGIHRLADDAFQWTVTEHHAIFDGWSLHSTLSEISATYQRLLAGENPVLEPLRSSYRDFIAAERAALSSEDSENFWLERLSDRPDCRLPRWPADRPALLAGRTMEDEWREHNEAEGYGSIETLLPADVCAGIPQLARRWGVPFKAVVLAVHLRVISLVTGSSDVLVGLTANGRLEEADSADVRGLFLNTVPFRIRLPEGTWQDLVRAVFETERELLPHRRYPLSALQRKLGGALFEVNFVYNHFHVLGKAFGADRMRIVDNKIDSFSTARVEPTNFPLNVGVIRNPYSSRLLLALDYHTDVLAQDQVAVLRDYYLRVFEAMVADPEASYRDVSLLGEVERGLLESWNDTPADVPAVLPHQLMEARAAACPDAVAVVDGRQRLTYRELNARANGLARFLRDAGVGPDVCVGLCVRRSVEMVVALLAIAKAGGVYVPLDADFPAERLHLMLSEVGASLVLTSGATTDRVPAGPWQSIDLDTVQPPPDEENPPVWARPDNGCYVIFTSGSTGRPKGVVTLHRNVTELLHGGEFLHLAETDTLLQLAPLPFDNSTFEVWAPLAAGARLVLAPAVDYTPADIATWVQEHQVTVLHATASLFALLVDHEPQLFDRLRRFLTGSETVSPRHAARVLERCPQLELVNCWGPTETTTFSVCGPYTRDTLPTGPLPLGNPLVNTQVWVLDDTGRPVPIGTPGELYVAGPCLARGYLNNPAMTAERFLPHPTQPGVRLYRTGDRGMWSADGRVEFLGRVDHMVKVRGYRVELGEVETALRAHPLIRECVVIARAGESSHADLAAYAVPDGEGVSPGVLRAWLAERLPHYMVPRWFVLLDALPLTPRAKVDRAALPAPQLQRPSLADFVPPLPGVEEQLAHIWRHVLDVDQVGRHDNFFDLGGDSIRSIQVLGQARDAGLTFTLQDQHRHPTLAELAGVVRHTADEDRQPAREPFSLLSAEDRERLPEGLADAYPMAELQVGMVYEMELDPDRRPYHNVHSLRIAGSFDEERFREAVARVVERHPILRTSFDLSGYSEPMQLVHPTVEVPFTAVDLRGADAREQQAALTEYVRRAHRNTFDLATAPLCRMAVHVVDDDAFQWTVTEHHAIFDGWSLASTLTEINALYRALLTGEDPAVEPLRSTYGDFIAAERQALRSEDSRGFWLEQLADRPDSRLPRWPARKSLPRIGERLEGDRHEHDQDTGHGALRTMTPQDVLTGLEELSQRWGVPFKAVVLAAHLRVMSMVTGSSDVLVGLTANGRLEEADGADVRGLFLNSVPLRLRLPKGTWQDLVRAVFEAERELLPHRRYPMSALQRELGGPLFEVNFVYNHFRQLGGPAEDGTLTVTDPGADMPGVARTHFSLVVAVSREPGADGLRLELEYNATELAEDQVAVLRDYYLRVFEAMVADPEASYRDVSLLGEAERGLLESWNDTPADVPAVLPHQLMEARATACPDAVAVVDGRQRLTYRELNARANGLARFLRDAGVGPDVCVGLCVRRSVEMVVALLAIAKAGGVYVPLDADFPAERLHLMLSEVGASLVLTSGATTDRVPAGPWQSIDLDTVQPPPDEEDPPVWARPDNGCYVIFTSGSTGRPKGVVTLHRNVTELLHGGESMSLRSDDRLLQIATTSFDVATYEVWAPLAAGARLVLAPAVDYTPADIATWVQEHQVTVLHATASLFALLVDHEPQLFDRLRRFLTGSETVSPRHAARVLERCPQLELVNCWGPTETTTFSVCGPYTRDTLPTGPLPLGNPLVNTQVWVLDDTGRPVPIGTPGELYVAGPCLARGYLNNPAMTAERFLPHPTQPGMRLYRTGDRGMWSADGRVEFLGRVDHMVKVRGYRVELGEVETALRAHPLIRECTVVACDDGFGHTDLVAYVVPDGEGVPADDLRRWLLERLPTFMAPRWFVFLAALPLTSRGKVDRRALPAPSTERPELVQEFVAPMAGLEESLAGIWSRVLGVDRVGRHDNFFDLGGDSIRSVQVLGKARETGLGFALQDLFQNPTLAGLARAVRPETDAAREPAREPFSLVPAEDRERLPEGLADAYPMAELQVGMVYEMELDPDRRPYHNVHSLRIAGSFDEERFREAVARVVDRHPILRTSFDLSGYSEPMQLVHPTVEVPFTAVDLRGADVREQQAALTESVRGQQRDAFDVSVAPLFRMAVHIVDDDAFQWTVTEHHAIFDGWSLASTLTEINALYRALLTGEDPAVEPLRSTYRDFVAAERAALRSEDSRGFWLERLADRPDGRLPRWPAGLAAPGIGEVVEGERHERDESQGHGSLTTVLSEDLLTRLEEFARRCGVPFKTVVLAAHLRALGLATGSPDVVTGLSSNGRLEEADAAEVCGLFLNTVPLRLRLPEG
ncbi:amino acid adenylation domain-containing protein, partial [Streptosporangium sp. NPDC087985]|uniref:non-ribosomal peptide synthetase n=1 Tax=Streptosporangium sp. NPDC087985 TaxID=3366196 RepID=UPI0038114FF2